MSEHYTKNTLEVTAYCRKCQRNTQHRVDGGRLGPCLEHDAPQFTKKQEAQRRQSEKERRQPNLFKK
jgi:hypothetical protein